MEAVDQRCYMTGPPKHRQRQLTPTLLGKKASVTVASSRSHDKPVSSFAQNHMTSLTD